MHHELFCPRCGASEETILAANSLFPDVCIYCGKKPCDRSAPECEGPPEVGRPSRVETYMLMAEIMARRSTCERGNVGVIAARGSRIIGAGYNGAPLGQDHCTAVGCDLSLGEEAGCQRAIHAEANVVAWAARAGVELEGATLYSTHSPCLRCAQLLAAARIGEFLYSADYRLARLDVLADAGVKIYRVAR